MLITKRQTGTVGGGRREGGSSWLRFDKHGLSNWAATGASDDDDDIPHVVDGSERKKKRKVISSAVALHGGWGWRKGSDSDVLNGDGDSHCRPMERELRLNPPSSLLLLVQSTSCQIRSGDSLRNKMKKKKKKKKDQLGVTILGSSE